jgi:MFS family permease
MVEEIPQEGRDRILDEEHLRLLSLGHYIAGGFVIAFTSLFIFYFILMLMIARHPDLFGGSNNAHPPPQGFFQIIAVFFGLGILAGLAFGGLIIYVGRCIKRRVRRTLTLVVACLNTLSMPFGTILGVFTLMVLTRPRVKLLYARVNSLSHSNP